MMSKETVSKVMSRVYWDERPKAPAAPVPRLPTASAAERAKSNPVRVGHQVSALLRTALAAAQKIAIELPPGDQRREELEALANALQRSSDLTSSLLYPVLGVPVQKECVALRALTRELVQLLRHAAPPSVIIDLQCRAGVTQVWADPAHLSAALHAICLNSIQAMPEGGRMKICVAPVPDEHGVPCKVGVLISDEGGGMDEATRERVFEAFFTTKTDAEGLGLTHAAAAIKEAQGEISIESKPGHGTQVTLFFPAAEAGTETLASLQPPRQRRTTSAPIPQQKKAVTAVGGKKAVLDRRRALVVDNNPHAAEETSRVLESLGMEVIAVNSAREALKRFEAESATLDVVVLDPGQAEISGILFLSRILAVRPDIRVLFLSEGGHVSMPGSVLSHPRVSLIKKPLDARRAEEVLSRLFA